MKQTEKKTQATGLPLSVVKPESVPLDRVRFVERRLDFSSNREINIPNVFKPKNQGVWTSDGARLDVVCPEQISGVIVCHFSKGGLETGNIVGEFPHEFSRVELWRDAERATKGIVIGKGAFGEVSALYSS
jgi:hypothetical protein